MTDQFVEETQWSNREQSYLPTTPACLIVYVLDRTTPVVIHSYMSHLQEEIHFTSAKYNYI